MRKALFLFLPLLLALPACKPQPPRGTQSPAQASPTPAPKKDFHKSVVKVFSTVQNADFYEPWKPGPIENLEGCGTILPGGLILTTAHLANKATYIEVQKFGETKRYAAKVFKTGSDLDMALLTVEDKEFAQGVEPVVFGELSQPGDKIFIQGGDELSNKDDSVSGIDMVYCWEGAGYVPAVMTNLEIEGKINGCPVFKEGKFVGMPFSSWHKMEKSGSLVPVPVVQRFLRSVAGDRAYDGLGDLGIQTQDLKSPALQEYYKLPAGKTGIVVTQVEYSGASDGILRNGDIITSVSGMALDNEGYVRLEKSGRASVDYLITLILPGEPAEVDIFRDGAPLHFRIPLKTEPKLVPFKPESRKPTYYMNAGFVFAPLTYNYILSADWKNMKPELKELSSHGYISKDRRQAVILSHVLLHDINKDYHYFRNILVRKVNGMPIGDMKDLVAAFQRPVNGRDVIEFDDHAWTGTIIVFDAKRAKKATAEIMEKLNIPSDRSADLQ